MTTKSIIRKLKKKDFVSWLATRRDDETFQYVINEDCLFARWLKELLSQRVIVGSDNFSLKDGDFCWGENIPFTPWMLKVVSPLNEQGAYNVHTMGEVKAQFKI